MSAPPDPSLTISSTRSSSPEDSQLEPPSDSKSAETCRDSLRTEGTARSLAGEALSEHESKFQQLSSTRQAEAWKKIKEIEQNQAEVNAEQKLYLQKFGCSFPDEVEPFFAHLLDGSLIGTGFASMLHDTVKSVNLSEHDNVNRTNKMNSNPKKRLSAGIAMTGEASSKRPKQTSAADPGETRSINQSTAQSMFEQLPQAAQEEAKTKLIAMMEKQGNVYVDQMLYLLKLDRAFPDEHKSFFAKVWAASAYGTDLESLLEYPAISAKNSSAADHQKLTLYTQYVVSKNSAVPPGKRKKPGRQSWQERLQLEFNEDYKAPTDGSQVWRYEIKLYHTTLKTSSEFIGNDGIPSHPSVKLMVNALKTSWNDEGKPVHDDFSGAFVFSSSDVISTSSVGGCILAPGSTQATYFKKFVNKTLGLGIQQISVLEKQIDEDGHADFNTKYVPKQNAYAKAVAALRKERKEAAEINMEKAKKSWQKKLVGAKSASLDLTKGNDDDDRQNSP
ncbi:hypothetical protein QFC21_006682 [Naganishia friedmannii]|uniref:Uncharacterized protein n=1 Tax=Naganishia friedmannii TaxID=89922 RepID=A0ACC2V1T3_9TREE|nr:hypothetical protein QFC21_006682 [Naganishia friedmannii]